MNPLVSLRFALGHPGLLGAALPGPSWEVWRITAMAALGEPLTAAEHAKFRRLSGRTSAPNGPVSEMAAIVGRRGGKTRALSSLAVYIAALCDHGGKLVSGERGVVLLIGPNQKQSRISLDYVSGILNESSELRSLVGNRTQDAIQLTNGIDVEVRAANFRQLRGVTCVAVLADETAFLADDASGSANPDIEILNAVRPSLATTGGPLLIASSPYRKSGALWDIYRSHYGVDETDVLVVKGTSRDFNPSLDQHVVDKAMARDPASARAEYLGEFRDDLEGYISREAVEACVDFGVRERAPRPGIRYFGFVDAAGGSGSDSMAMAVGHVTDGQVILDALRETRPPFSPNVCVSGYATLLKAYGIREVTGDKYAGEFPRELFRLCGIDYRLSELNKSQIYIESLPRLNSETIRLLDNDRLVSQLIQLERRHGRTSRDVIDHPPRGSDDIANVAMGIVTIASAKRHSQVFTGTIGADMQIRLSGSEPKQRAWRRTGEWSMKMELKLPLCINEAAVERQYGIDTASGGRIEDRLLDKACAALKLSRQLGERAIQAHKTIMANQLATPLANQRQSKETTWKLVEQSTRSLDEARLAAYGELDSINVRLSGPPKPKDLAEVGLHREIREALLAMPTTARVKFINDAIVSGDTPICAAVLNVPAFLLGLHDSQLNMMRHNWQARHFPNELSRRKRLQAAIADMDNAGHALQTFILGLTDADKISEAEASELAAKAASAA